MLFVILVFGYLKNNQSLKRNPYIALYFTSYKYTIQIVLSLKDNTLTMTALFILKNR